MRAPREILRLREGEQAVGDAQALDVSLARSHLSRPRGVAEVIGESVGMIETQQLADLARPHARLRLGKDPRLVLRGERAALGLLDQLRVRHPRRRGAPAGPESQLAYVSLVFAAGGSSLNRCSSPSSIRARLQHLGVAPFSPSRSLIPRW